MIPILSDVEIYGSLNVNKNITVNSTLKVKSNTTLNGPVEINNNATISGTLEVGSDTTLTHNLEVGNSISCTTLTVKQYINNNIYFNNDKTIDIKNNLKINYKIVEYTVNSSNFEFSVDYYGKIYKTSFWNDETGEELTIMSTVRFNTFYGTVTSPFTSSYRMKGIISYIVEDNSHNIITIKDVIYKDELTTKYYGNNIDDINLMRTLGGCYTAWLRSSSATGKTETIELGNISFKSDGMGSVLIPFEVLNSIWFFSFSIPYKFNSQMSIRIYNLTKDGFEDSSGIYPIEDFYFTRSIIQ